MVQVFPCLRMQILESGGGHCGASFLNNNYARSSAPDFVCGQLYKSDSNSGEGDTFFYSSVWNLTHVFLGNTIAYLTRLFRSLPPSHIVLQNSESVQGILNGSILFCCAAMVLIEFLLPFV